MAWLPAGRTVDYVPYRVDAACCFMIDIPLVCDARRDGGTNGCGGHWDQPSCRFPNSSFFWFTLFFLTTFYLFCSPVWLGSFTDWKSNGNSLPLFLGLSRSRLPRSFSLTWCVSLVTSLFWFGSLIFHSGFTSIGSFLLRVVYWIDGKFDRLDSI